VVSMTKPDRNPDDARMSLGDHLDELRRRIIYMLVGLAVTTAACLVFAPELIAFLKRPYADVMLQLGLEPNLAVLDVSAGLTNYLKVSFYAGIVLAAPWLFYQLWAFISAGLYEREKRYVRLAAPLCAGLFVTGAMFFVLLVARQVLFYLLSLSRWLGMVPVITFENHINFMTRMMLVFGLAFQTPVLILGLATTGLLTLKMLHHYRKHVVVVILVLAAVLTPPDPFSQIALAIPMWLLYEFGVGLSYLLVFRRRNRSRAESESRI